MTKPYKTFVPPKGDVRTAQYIFVSGQPQPLETMRRQAFTGQMSHTLNPILAKLDIHTHDCYYTHAIKSSDMPLKRYIEFTKSGPVVSDLGHYFITLLFNELSEARPDAVIIPLGGEALFAVMDLLHLQKWRGSLLKNPDTDWHVVPTHNPQDLMRGMYERRFLIERDINHAKQWVNTGLSTYTPEMEHSPTFERARSWLNRMYANGIKGHTIAFDIEVSNMEISCFSITDNDQHCLCIPFLDANRNNYYNAAQETDLLRLLGKVLEHPAIKICGQNIGFDASFMMRKYGIASKNLEDTMIAQRTVMGEFQKGLGFICSIWTDIPYYKDDGKDWFHGKSTDIHKFWDYSNMDSLALNVALPKMRKTIKQHGNMRAYERQTSLLEPLIYMMERGVKIDVDGMVAYSNELRDKLKNQLAELHDMCGFELNPQSPKQVADFFYTQKGAYKYKKQGRVTTDDDAMKRLARTYPEAALIRDIRKTKKILGTYVPVDDNNWPIKVDKDGRIRCSYDPVGTRFSRISSSENIFGTGMNLQNWPHNLKRFMVCDEDMIYISFDLATAENRIVAYVGNIAEMIEVFESGMDAHVKTASLIFGKPYEQISDESGSSSLGDGSHSERSWGKKANHGLNYDLGANSFALKYECMPMQAKMIVAGYHNAYPNVRNGFHRHVRDCLNKNRTLVNLMGRKTVFFGQNSDKLYKEAYACIPQGTIGDLLNERGLAYTYKNQHKFKDLDIIEQVHDSFGFQVPRPKTPEDYKKLAEQLIDIKNSLELELHANGRYFKIPADITIGTTTLYKGHCVEVKASDGYDTADKLAAILPAKLRESDGRNKERATT